MSLLLLNTEKDGLKSQLQGGPEEKNSSREASFEKKIYCLPLNKTVTYLEILKYTLLNSFKFQS